jgi:hypothetical protein
VDAVSIYHAGLQGLGDPAVLAHASAQGRVLLTHNIRDFVALHHQYLAEGRSHSGILLSHELYVGRLVTRILAFISQAGDQDMAKQLYYL